MKSCDLCRKEDKSNYDVSIWNKEKEDIVFKINDVCLSCSKKVKKLLLNQLKKESGTNLIEIPDEKRVEVLTILLQNGNFRSLNKNTFEIENNVEEVIKQIKDKGIEVKRI